MRKISKTVLAGLLSGGVCAPSLAQIANVRVPASPGAALGAAATAPTALRNPASFGGVSSFIGLSPAALSAPAAASPAPSAAAAAPAVAAAAFPLAAAPAAAAALPLAAAAPAPAAAVAASPLAAPALPAVGGLRGAAAAMAEEPRAAAASNQFFDLARAAAAGMGSPVDGGQARADGGSSHSDGDAPLGKLYPRVVIILDALDRPAQEGDKLVKYIEALSDKGVKIVFVTARPEKGENSAESMLVSKLKVRTGNPLIVVSYNGARIALHNSKAENPKPLIPDQEPFAEKTLARFREIDATVRAKLGAKVGAAEFGYPNLEAPYIYGAEIPAGVDAGDWTTAYNRALKSAGFDYKIEAAQGADARLRALVGRAVYFTQSTALRLNTRRVFNAIYAAAPELDPAKGGHGVLKPQQVLILADPAKAPSFLQSLPSRGYFIHGVNDTASLERTLEAVLGGATLEQVMVNKFELREYLDWLERRQYHVGKRGSKRGSKRGGGRSWSRDLNAPGWHEMAFYRGILIKELMSRLYHLMKNEALEEASLDSAVTLLEKMWRHPEANGVRLPEVLQLARQTDSFRMRQKGGLEIAKRWLKNYYHRHFPDYPRGINEKVVGRLLRLARDGDSVTLDYASPYTGRSYKVYVRPDRTELWEDEKGYILVGHVYRTGKEPFQTKFDESVEVNLVGRALLEGDAQKREDGRWYVNSEPDPRVMIVFHYNTRDLQSVMTTAEVESHTPEVTALIEKRAADREYQKWVEEKAKEIERARVNLKRTVTRQARAKARKETEDKR